VYATGLWADLPVHFGLVSVFGLFGSFGLFGPLARLGLKMNEPSSSNEDGGGRGSVG
jgi:hypothetical protein